MKNKFNIVSLAKALAHDISPVRIHKHFKKMNDAYLELNPNSWLASSFSHAAAAAEQVWGATISATTGFSCGAAGGFLVTGGGNSSPKTVVVAALIGGMGGLLFLNPLCAKMIVKYHKASARRWDKVMNREESECRQISQFDAYPETRKVLTEMQPQ